MGGKEFFLVRLTMLHQSSSLFGQQLHSQVRWATSDQEGGKDAQKNPQNIFNLWNNQHRSCNPFLIMCQWILIYPHGDEMTNWILTGPLLWLCTVKSGQKSRSAMARSSDSANGRAPSSSSSSSVWKGRTYCWHLIRSRQWTLFIVYRSLKEMV